MAELADAHGSGPCDSNIMEVQVLLSASETLIQLYEGFLIRRCSLMVKHQLPKLRSGVRFPSPAPYGNDASVEFFQQMRRFL